MPKLSFVAVIDITGINPYVRVSARRARALRPDWRKPMPVLVRINGQPARRPWRINMMPMGTGDFYLYLHGDVRRASETKVGDKVRVELAFDSAYRNGPLRPMPSWFRAALAKNARAHTRWKALVPSRQKEVIRYLVGLKSEAARTRNLARALQALGGPQPEGKRGRFMARSW